MRVLDNGDLSCWGMGSYGMLGSGDFPPRGAANEVGDNLHVLELGTGYTVDDVSVGQNHACAILDDGDELSADVMKCWGSGFGGALGSENQQNLGDSQFQMGDLLPYVDLGSDIQPTSVEAGRSFMRLMNTTKVKCWGSGLDGRTGQGIADSSVTSQSMGDNLPYVELTCPRKHSTSRATSQRDPCNLNHQLCPFQTRGQNSHGPNSHESTCGAESTT